MTVPAFAQSAQRRVHYAIGGLIHSFGSISSHAGIAASADPRGTYADLAMRDIAQARELLNEMELALQCVKADWQAREAA